VEKMKLVVIEDEVKIARMIKDYLEKEGASVYLARDGASGLQLVREEDPHLVILDLMLPDINGLEVCRLLRQQSDIPIIMLTAKSQETDRIVGLEIGADDYITKPFSLAELAARVRAVLRRTRVAESRQNHAEKILTRGPFSLDIENHQVKKGQQEILLTPTEFSLLAFMARSPGRVFSRLQLLEVCLGEAYSGYERSIDTHIRNLRKKIETDPAHPVYIITVFGLGYKFQVPTNQEDPSRGVIHGDGSSGSGV